MARSRSNKNKFTTILAAAGIALFIVLTLTVSTLINQHRFTSPYASELSMRTSLSGKETKYSTLADNSPLTIRRKPVPPQFTGLLDIQIINDSQNPIRPSTFIGPICYTEGGQQQCGHFVTGNPIPPGGNVRDNVYFHCSVSGAISITYYYGPTNMYPSDVINETVNCYTYPNSFTLSAEAPTSGPPTPIPTMAPYCPADPIHCFDPGYPCTFNNCGIYSGTCTQDNTCIPHRQMCCGA